MNFDTKHMRTNTKNQLSYINSSKTHVNSILEFDNNQSSMNNTVYSARLNKWFFGIITLLFMFAETTQMLAQNVITTYSGASSSWTVPYGVSSITVRAKGGAGGYGGTDGAGSVAAGPSQVGIIEATYSVTPGDVISFYPGGAGGNGATTSCGGGGAAGIDTYPLLNFNGGTGGNAACSGSSGGGGGGGAATVVTINSSIVIVAAGAGGGGGNGNCYGSGYSGNNITNSTGSYNGGNGAAGNACGQADGGGSGAGGGGYFGSWGGGSHLTSCGGECGGDGGYRGTCYVTNAASVLNNGTYTWFSGGNVIVEYTAVAGTASANQTICSGNNPGNLTLAGYIGDVQWQVSSDNVNFSNISGATSATLTSAQMGVLTATRYYRALVSGVVYSNTVVVTVNPSPVFSINNSLCTTNTLQWMSMTNIS